MDKFEEFNKAFNPKDEACYKICVDKKPVDSNLYMYADVKDEAKRQIGWLVTDNFIVVDVDDMVDAELIYKICMSKKLKFLINKTRKGSHFFFKKKPNESIPQGAKFQTPIGIKIDTRSPGKGYLVLPINDPDRKWGKMPDEFDFLPYFLYPQNKLKNVPDFRNMEQGERNNSLFVFYMNLLDYASGLNLEEKKGSIHIINDFLLKDKVSDKELKTTILRDDLIDKILKKSNSIEEISERMVKDNAIITCNENSYMYNGKYYEHLTDADFHKFIHFNYMKKAKDTERKEIQKFVMLKTSIPEPELNKDWYIINVNNGRLNLKTLELEEHTQAAYDTIHINIDYDPHVEGSVRVNDFMNFLADGDKSKKRLLYEIVGYCLIKKNIFQKAFIFYGEGKNGKSTFMDLIARLIGVRNISFTDLAEFSGNNFRSSELFNKLVNLGDDMSFQSLKETNVIKKLISGENIYAERKYKNPFPFKNFATMIFSTNQMPHSTDKTFGFFRRLVLLDFEKKIDKADPLFLERFETNDFKFLFNQACIGISKALKNNNLTTYSKSEEMLEKYRTNISNVLSFIKDENITPVDVHLQPINTLYESYKIYCDDSGFKPYNKNNFNEELAKEFKCNKRITTKDGRDNKTRWVVPGIEKECVCDVRAE